LAVCGAAEGLACACLGVPFAAARHALLAAATPAARLNRPLAHAGPPPPPTGAAAGGGVEEGEGGGWVELRATMLAGGPTAGLTRDAVRGLTLLYDEPYSHKTDAAALRAAAAAAGCTHIVVAAAQAGEGAGGTLKVAAAGEVGAALGGTAGDETRVSHGAHWYCRRERGFGFAPNDDVETGDPFRDTSHADDPLRLSWIIDGYGGGYRAGDVCDLYTSDEWRKLVWGFRL
jgi:hypothetical protein